jgi:sarcosine oxidase subunit beta
MLDMSSHQLGNADVVVIGAGAIGLSVACELRRLGAEIIVLEAMAAPGLGSTGRAMGGVRAQFSTIPNIAFSVFSISAFERLASAHSDILTFHQVGYLLLAGNPDTARYLRSSAELQRSQGVETELLSAEEVSAIAPNLRSDGIEVASFHSRDGFLDPYAVTTALHREIRALGGKVVARTQVTGLVPQGASGLRVKTPSGDLATTWVVNAAGPDAAEVAALIGSDLPVIPVRRNLAFIDGPRQSLMPMSVDLDTGVVVRREVGGGYVAAYADPSDPPSKDMTLDPTFLPKLATRIGNRFPFLVDVPVNSRQCWAGLYPETADHHAVIGVFPDIPKVVHCAGFGGHSLMHSPAAGRAVAELIIRGSCTTFDLHMLRPTRFAENDLILETAVF